MSSVIVPALCNCVYASLLQPQDCSLLCKGLTPEIRSVLYTGEREGGGNIFRAEIEN